MDAISLSLAYKAAQQASTYVPEERLQYGFRTRPKNAEKTKIVPDIPEEKLQAVDKAVVELQLTKLRNNFEEEEELEEELEEEEVVVEDFRANRLGYSDIGYLPAKHKEPRFATHNCGGRRPTPSCQQQLPRPEPPGNCGFRPGSVIIEEGRPTAVQINEEQLQHEDLQNAEIIDINFVDGQYAGVGYDRFRRHLSQAIVDAVRKAAEEVSTAKVDEMNRPSGDVDELHKSDEGSGIEQTPGETDFLLTPSNENNSDHFENADAPKVDEKIIPPAAANDIPSEDGKVILQTSADDTPSEDGKVILQTPDETHSEDERERLHTPSEDDKVFLQSSVDTPSEDDRFILQTSPNDSPSEDEKVVLQTSVDSDGQQFPIEKLPKESVDSSTSVDSSSEPATDNKTNSSTPLTTEPFQLPTAVAEINPENKSDEFSNPILIPEPLNIPTQAVAENPAMPAEINRNNHHQPMLITDRMYFDTISELVAKLSLSLQHIKEQAFAKDILFVPNPEMIHEAIDDDQQRNLPKTNLFNAETPPTEEINVDTDSDMYRFKRNGTGTGT